MRKSVLDNVTLTGLNKNKYDRNIEEHIQRSFVNGCQKRKILGKDKWLWRDIIVHVPGTNKASNLLNVLLRMNKSPRRRAKYQRLFTGTNYKMLRRTMINNIICDFVGFI